MRFNNQPASVCHGRVGRASRRAFSLIEIMIVVVIIGLMAGVVTLATTGYLERAKKERARSDIATYSTALDSYYLQKGKFPETQEGLKVLVPDFVKAITTDPWGHPYQYLKPGKSTPYEVISYGADGREGASGADADILASEIQTQNQKK
jgi:general secretion pathway protein G